MVRKAMKKRKDFSLNVYGENYRVVFKNNIINPHNGQECAGLCDSSASTIYIDSNSDNEYTACIIFHELFHAYARRMGMENSGMSYELEEIIADQFGKLLSENFDFDF